MKKLVQQCAEIKAMLQTNRKTAFKLDNVLRLNKTFFTTVTQEDFEEACIELGSEMEQSVASALYLANVSIEQIDAVELVGEGSRTNFVQNLLGSLFPKHKVGMHMNAEESAVLGAAKHGSKLAKLR